jgi:hypothetical protein
MKVSVGRMAIVLLAAAYVLVWGSSLVVALQNHADEVLEPAGHGALETSFIVLSGITRPVGMLAHVILNPAPSGRAGIVVLWCVAGVLGAIQWTAVTGMAVLIWRQFRPRPTTLTLR